MNFESFIRLLASEAWTETRIQWNLFPEFAELVVMPGPLQTIYRVTGERIAFVSGPDTPPSPLKDGGK